ncbi:MAG: serine hydrolase domain-containing protein [Gemmatimonadota bacterium]
MIPPPGWFRHRRARSPAEAALAGKAMRRFGTAFFVLALMIGAFGFIRTDIHRIYLPTGTGITAKQVCSLHFVTGMSPERARALYVDPLLGAAAGLVSADVREEEVRSGFLGLLYRQRAVYREGIGCTLIHSGRDFDEDLALPMGREFEPMTLDTAHRDVTFRTAALKAAIDTAFAEPGHGSRNTLAVVVLHRGKLVAERYGEGVTRATPLHGWSMAKSAVATLAGTMVQRGEIRLDASAIRDASVIAEEPRKGEITLEHLLRMRAGLRLDETQSGRDPNSKMLFTESDMAGWAARQPLVHPPGEHWEYMSGQTVLATRALQNALPGEGLAADLGAVRERVFEPLEMYSAVFETDEAGTLQGSSYLYAAAQDWARLAQLYVDDGMAGDTRVLPADWAETVSRTAAGVREKAYGLGFWLGHPSDDAPRGAYYMSGFQGQVAYVFPEQELVVVRLGATNHVASGAHRFAADVAAALTPDM